MWQLAQAKNKLSEVFTRAMTEGPQTITRRGQRVVMVSGDDYDRLMAEQPKKMTLGEYLLNAPKVEGLVIERDRSPPREIDFGPDDE